MHISVNTEPTVILFLFWIFLKISAYFVIFQPCVDQNFIYKYFPHKVHTFFLIILSFLKSVLG